MSGTERKSSRPRPSPRGMYLAVALAISLLALLVGWAGYRNALDRYTERAATEARNAGRLIENDLQEDFDRIDVALQSSALYIRDRAGETLANASGTAALLAEQQRMIPELDHIRVIDSQGAVIFSSPALAKTNVNLSDSEAFVRLRDDPAAGLVITGPELGRIAKQWELVLARRIVDRNGHFAGVIYGGMPVERFEASFRRAGLGAGTSFALRNSAFALVYRFPPAPGAAASVGSISREIEDLARRDPEGQFRIVSPIDRVERLYAFHRFSRYPFHISVGLSVEEVVAEARRTSRNVAVLTALILLVTWGGAWFSYRSLLRRDRAELALAAGEQRLRFAMDATTDGIWDWRLDSGEVYYSPQYFRMLGYRPEEFAGRTEDHWMGLLHPEERERVVATARDLANRQGGYDMEFRLRASDGTYRWIQSRGKVVERAGDGSPRRMVGTHTDITARKHMDELLRAANDEQRAIFDAATVGIALVRDRRIVRCNRRLETIFGFAAGTMRDKSLGDFNPGSQAPDGNPIDIEALIAVGGTHRAELELARRDGTPFWGRITARLLDERQPVRGILAIVEDITPERESQEELRRAKELAEAAAQAKADFLANMSHEIRTPMNAIIGMAHLALQTELTPRQRDYLGKIDGASQHLLAIINDILDLSRIEAGKLAIERAEFELDHLLDRVAMLLTEKASSQGLELVVDVDASVPRVLVGDSLRIEQVLLNLGSNAVKFTERGEVVISVRMAERRGDAATLRFAVRDTGIGLTTEQRGRLFQVFQQGDVSTTRKHGGTGLGLAISRHLVELMGGEIGVESEPGRGSNFWFTIQAGISTQAARVLVPQPDLRARRVLVVDDNDSARSVLHSMLANMTFKVTDAATGAAAVDAVRAAAQAGEPFDIVCLDWHMPDLDGLEVSRRVRALHLQHPPHVLMITAYGRERLAEQANAAGIEGFLTKPVSPSLLFDSAVRLLAGRRETARSDGAGPKTELERLAPIRGARILVVEDNELNQEVARELLTGAGLVVDTADNGQVALDMLRRQRYDLLFMDMQMPVMDGLAATQAIRQQPEFAALPIVAMTANAMQGDAERCIAAGMNDYVAKPIEPERLWSALLRWIPTRSATTSPVNPVAAAEPATTAPLLPPAIAGIDLAAGLRRVADSPSLYVSVLRMFVDGHRQDADEIRRCVGESDWAGAVRRAHTVKGLAGTIGADELQQRARELELSLKNPEARTNSTLTIAAFARSLDAIVAAIDAALPGPVRIPAAPAAPVDRERLSAACRELHGLLKTDDMRAHDCLTRHDELLRTAFGEQYTRIEAAAGQFDFAAARVALKTACDAHGVALPR